MNFRSKSCTMLQILSISNPKDQNEELDLHNAIKSVLKNQMPDVNSLDCWQGNRRMILLDAPVDIRFHLLDELLEMYAYSLDVSEVKSFYGDSASIRYIVHQELENREQGQRSVQGDFLEVLAKYPERSYQFRLEALYQQVQNLRNDLRDAHISRPIAIRLCHEAVQKILLKIQASLEDCLQL